MSGAWWRCLVADRLCQSSVESERCRGPMAVTAFHMHNQQQTSSMQTDRMQTNMLTKSMLTSSKNMQSKVYSR